MTLSDHLADYERDQRATTEAHLVTIRRAFMAGALAALTSKTHTREQLLQEVVMYGRTVGTAVERAT